MKATITLISLSAFLLGCGSINPVTLAKVARLSPLDADPAVMGVEIELPPGIGVREGEARITFFSTRTDTNQSISETFVLEDMNNSQFQIARDDLDRLRETQTTVRNWETEAPRANSGGINVTVGPCIYGNGPDPDARASLSVRIDESGTFYPLVTNGPLSEVVGDEDLSAFPTCAGPT